MAAIAEHLRVPALRRLGLSEPLIRLSSGECVHEMFRFSCLGPPHYVYHDAGTPDGPPLIPLWDYNDVVVAVWERPDGMEFFKFDIEAPDEYWVKSRTEQGFWAGEFDFYYETETPIEELRAAAEVIGFRYLDRLIESREGAEGRLGTFEAHDIWQAELVGSIDRESGSEPTADFSGT